ncbi:MAG TPA: zinc-binding dehydrogenase [Candidatus Acidoferrum sp.]
MKAAVYTRYVPPDVIQIMEVEEPVPNVTPVIDRRYPLSETAGAIRYLEEGHARGKNRNNFVMSGFFATGLTCLRF